MYEWEVYIRVGHFENSETTDQRRKKRRKKGKELEGKGQALLQERGSIGCYKSGFGNCLRATADE